jgi:hypothetical protein
MNNLKNVKIGDAIVHEDGSTSDGICINNGFISRDKIGGINIQRWNSVEDCYVETCLIKEEVEALVDFVQSHVQPEENNTCVICQKQLEVEDGWAKTHEGHIFCLECYSQTSQHSSMNHELAQLIHTFQNAGKRDDRSSAAWKIGKILDKIPWSDPYEDHVPFLKNHGMKDASLFIRGWLEQ